jgi:hypothetical protein
MAMCRYVAICSDVLLPKPLATSGESRTLHSQQAPHANSNGTGALRLALPRDLRDDARAMIIL